MSEQGELFHMEHERPDRAHQPGAKWGGHLSRKARAIVKAMLPGACWRCGTPLTVEGEWHAGHVEDRGTGGELLNPSNLAPECTPCNLSAGGKVGAAITNGRRIEAVDIARIRRTKWW